MDGNFFFCSKQSKIDADFACCYWETPSTYTLSHPENDRDVTDRVQEYTLQDASFMR